MQFTILSIAALISAVSAVSNSTITTEVTVTDWVTYCPEETTITLTTCVKDKCNKHEITVTEATTLTVTGECIIPTTIAPVTTTRTVHPVTTIKPETTQTVHPRPDQTITISTYEGAGAKQVVGGLAGLAMVAALL